MNAALIGLAVGLVLGVAGAFGGFPAFVIVAVLGALGFGIGYLLENRVDLPRVFDTDRDRVPR